MAGFRRGASHPLLLTVNAPVNGHGGSSPSLLPLDWGEGVLKGDCSFEEPYILLWAGGVLSHGRRAPSWFRCLQ